VEKETSPPRAQNLSERSLERIMRKQAAEGRASGQSNDAVQVVPGKGTLCRAEWLLSAER
jgi:hypothetical protein